MEKPDKEALLPYRNIVNYYANAIMERHDVSRLYTADDVEQELWLAIILNWEKVQQVEDERDKFSFVKVLCDRRIKALITISNTRKRTNTDYVDFDQLDCMRDFANGIGAGEEAYFGKELISLVLEFTSQQTGKIRLFMDNLLNPSREFLTWYEENKSEGKRGRASVYASMLSKFVYGFNTKHYKILDKLKRFLQTRGYGDSL